MQLGKYELHEIIGRGGFGTVYRATDLTLDREVAFKELHPALTVDPEFIERFQREARVVARLKHPNIVPIYELGEISGHYFIVMEYLAGGSLQKRLEKEGKLSFSTTLDLLRQVTDALHYAHSQGLVHRDLKPGNVLFDTAGRAYVSDFGFAKVFGSSGSSSSSSSGRGMVGTPPYMAPEIWLGESVSAATDIYALACLVCETLTGKPLFTGDSPPVIMARHFQPLGSLNLPADVPADLEKVLRKALVASPADRYADATEFYESVKNVLPTPLAAEIPVIKAEPVQASTPVIKAEPVQVSTPVIKVETIQDPTSVIKAETIQDPTPAVKTEPVQGSTPTITVEPVQVSTPAIQTEPVHDSTPTITADPVNASSPAAHTPSQPAAGTAQVKPAPPAAGKPAARKRISPWIWIGAAILIVILCLSIPVFSNLISQVFNPVPAATMAAFPTATNASAANAVLFPTATNVPAANSVPFPTATNAPSSLPIRTPTRTQEESTTAPYVLKACTKNITVACIQGYSKSDVPSSVTVILNQSQAFYGNYHLLIDGAYYKCAIYKDYPTRLFCTGSSKVRTNVALSIEFYQTSPEKLLAAGTISMVFIPTPVPTTRYP